MTVNISFNSRGFAKVEQKLSAIEARSTNFIPVLTQARVELNTANAANFGLGGLPSGGWAPLSPSYGSWKLAHFPGVPPMVKTGRLSASLSGGTAESIFSMTPKKMQVGTRVEYAKFHQYGTSKMPARRVVFEPPLFAKKLGGSAARWMTEGEIL